MPLIPGIALAILLIVIVVLLIVLRTHSHRMSLDERLDPLSQRLAEFSSREESLTLEDIELSQPFTERVLVPILKKLRRGIQADKPAGREANAQVLKKGYSISVSHPKLLSKRFESAFLLQIFLAKEYTRVRAGIKSEFADQEPVEHVRESGLKKGDVIKVKFFHPDIEFSDPAPKVIDAPLKRIVLLGKPKDGCEPGQHKILVSISDVETEQELESFTITVRVTDFVFGKVSRPLLSRVSAVILGLGSFTMFVLALLEQIDKTVGLTSGTAAGVLMLAISTNFYNLYQRGQPTA